MYLSCMKYIYIKKYSTSSLTTPPLCIPYTHTHVQFASHASERQKRWKKIHLKITHCRKLVWEGTFYNAFGKYERVISQLDTENSWICLFFYLQKLLFTYVFPLSSANIWMEETHKKKWRRQKDNKCLWFFVHVCECDSIDDKNNWKISKEEFFWLISPEMIDESVRPKIKEGIRWPKRT